MPEFNENLIEEKKAGTKDASSVEVALFGAKSQKAFEEVASRLEGDQPITESSIVDLEKALISMLVGPDLVNSRRLTELSDLAARVIEEMGHNGIYENMRLDLSGLTHLSLSAARIIFSHPWNYVCIQNLPPFSPELAMILAKNCRSLKVHSPRIIGGVTVSFEAPTRLLVGEENFKKFKDTFEKLAKSQQ